MIAATNTDLAKQVSAKEFRDDLYYRLKVMEVNIAPLRDRREDILLLMKLFLEEYNREFNRHIQGFNSKTEELLTEYAWPGNVRELKNVIERGVILCQDNMMLPEHLPLELRKERKQRRECLWARYLCRTRKNITSSKCLNLSLVTNRKRPVFLIFRDPRFVRNLNRTISHRCSVSDHLF